MKWRELLLNWYKTHARSFPWRETRDPYRVWLSEIILQQTRTQQGLPYYEKFIETFPTVESLADASLEEILKLWQGLGYYSRARNLHITAQNIRDHYHGEFPQSFEELLQLKGVGDYTASAIGSICFNLPQPVVDGNVFRVLSRYFGDSFPIDHHKALAHYKSLAFELMGNASPADFNQAMMEFGALHCTPKKPLCGTCPFQNECLAYQTQSVFKFPQKKNRIKTRDRYLHYLVIKNKRGQTLLQKRNTKDIWEGLYEFPLIETSTEASPSEADWNQLLSAHKINQRSAIELVLELQHKLSHQKLHIFFWETEQPSKELDKKNLLDPKGFPLPVPLLNFVREYFPTER